MDTYQNRIKEIKEIKEIKTKLPNLGIIEENHKSIIEDDAFFRTDLDGKLLVVHESYYKTIGYCKDEILNMNISEIFVTKNPYEIEHKIKDTINNGFVRFHSQHKCKSGELIDIKVIARYNKKTKSISFFNGNITNNKLTKNKLVENDNNIRSIFHELNEVILEIDINGNYIEIIPTSPELTYKPKEEWLGKSIKETLNKKKADLFLSSIQQSIIKNKRITFEYSLIKDKKEIWFEARVTPRTNNTAIIITRNITSEKDSLATLEKRDKEIEQINERLQIATDSAGIGVWELDLVTNTLLWDQWMHKLYGINTDKFEGAYEAWKSGVHPEDIVRADKEVEDAINGNGIFDTKFRIITLKGEIRHLKAFAKVIKDKNGKPVRMTGVNYDITNIVLAEKALKENEKKYRLITENSTDVIWTMDFNLDYKYLSPSSEKITGYSIEERHKIKEDELFDIEQYTKVKAMLRNWIKEHINDPLSAPSFNFELSGIKADNTSFVVEVVGGFLIENDKAIGLQGSSRDITVRRKIEKELKEAKLKAEESDRLKSAFLANMSHEIRTPMNGILGFSDLLKENNLSGEEQQKYIEIIRKSGKRMLETINDIVEISKIEVGDINLEYDIISINEQLDYLFNFFKHEAELKNIALIYDKSADDENSYFKTDNKIFCSILTNLIKNAIKYTEKGNIEFGYKNKNTFIEFFVKDTGIGIPQDKHIEIFNRFTRIRDDKTKVIEGSGLGLSIAHAYVKILGGKIWLESIVNIGTTFYFKLPLIPKQYIIL